MERMRGVQGCIIVDRRPEDQEVRQRCRRGEPQQDKQPPPVRQRRMVAQVPNHDADRQQDQGDDKPVSEHIGAREFQNRNKTAVCKNGGRRHGENAEDLFLGKIGGRIFRRNHFSLDHGV